MHEESWHQARLIPTSGINGAQEQERRATSAPLAVLSVVPEFSKALLAPLGAIRGTTETFIEVPFESPEGKVFPDGLIRIRRGSRQWTALIEVKTGKNELEAQQLESYLDIARAEGFDALITISNEIPPIPGHHPTSVDRRKLRKVALHHIPWSFVLFTAIMQKEHRGVSDPEQAWILGELIRYLEHSKSGALELDDMGKHWVSIRESVASGTFRANDAGGAEVASRFDALLRYAGLRLGQQLGIDVTPALTRAEIAEPQERMEALLKQLASDGSLTGGLRIPHAVGPLTVSADLRAGRVTCQVDIPAPQTGRQLTRVNWVVRQLKNARPDVRIETLIARARGEGPTELLEKVREDPKSIAPDSNREIKGFRVALSVAMGPKRGRGRGSFIDSVVETVDEFYGDVIQNIKPWSPSPPKMRPSPELDGDTLSSTDLSSQDQAVAPA
ncbi:stress response protein [Aeromicrobium phragmitis]|uniref:Stress response protein n=1 Tax=Aeromicrobium phragmitis TaxID=2478914 RepID=A0A3L8PKL3_9ACTN|nr:stress response protein [Aeromicrobium phragmitis]RLV55861.1 stress response protein [Aeromicrobium phragmitis]